MLGSGHYPLFVAFVHELIGSFVGVLGHVRYSNRVAFVVISVRNTVMRPPSGVLIFQTCAVPRRSARRASLLSMPGIERFRGFTALCLSRVE